MHFTAHELGSMGLDGHGEDGSDILTQGQDASRWTGLGTGNFQERRSGMGIG